MKTSGGSASKGLELHCTQAQVKAVLFLLLLEPRLNG